MCLSMTDTHKYNNLSWVRTIHIIILLTYMEISEGSVTMQHLPYLHMWEFTALLLLLQSDMNPSARLGWPDTLTNVIWFLYFFKLHMM